MSGERQHRSELIRGHPFNEYLFYRRGASGNDAYPRMLDTDRPGDYGDYFSVCPPFHCGCPDPASHRVSPFIEPGGKTGGLRTGGNLDRDDGASVRTGESRGDIGHEPPGE